MDLGFVNFQEIVEHLDPLTTRFSLIEVVIAWSEFPTDPVYFVGSLLTIVGHDDRTIEIAIYQMFIFKTLITFVYNC